MKVNLISSRAKGVLANPVYFNPDQTEVFHVILNDANRVLALTHCENPASIEFILAEIVAKFALNKSVKDLWKINFREVENFLRDENHLPAFSEDHVAAAEIFIDIKISVIAGAIKALLKNEFFGLLKSVSHWEKLTLVEKNIWANKILSPLGWELVLSEADLIYIKAPPEISSEELPLTLDTLLLRVLYPASRALPSSGEILLPVKLVAV